jgi:hypothetical protein
VQASGDRIRERCARINELMCDMHKQISMPGGDCGNSITLHHHMTVVFGELNFSIDAPSKRVEDLLARGEWSQLQDRDELRLQIQAGGTLFGFHESSFCSPPEKRGAADCGYIGWDSRILWNSSPICSCDLLAYKKEMGAACDGQPTVSAVFVVETVRTTFISPKLPLDQTELPCGPQEVVLSGLRASGLPAVHSSIFGWNAHASDQTVDAFVCVAAPNFSLQAKAFSSVQRGCPDPSWSAEQLVIHVDVPDARALRLMHLIVSVRHKTRLGLHSPLGDAAVALFASAGSSAAMPFAANLEQNGKSAGTIEGRITVRARRT